MEITSISSIMNYSINGFMNHSYAIYVGLIVIITTIIGLLILNYVLEQFKRTSFISFFMGLFFICSFIIVVVRMVTIYKNETNIFTFYNYCSPSSYSHKMTH